VGYKRGSLIDQIVRFNIVGVVSNALMYLLFSALVYIGMAYDVALVIDYVVGGVVSYVYNKGFTFDDRGPHKKRSVLMMMILLVLLFVLNLYMLYYLVERYVINIYVSQLIAAFVCAVTSFYVQKMHVFKS